jgi:hypothetical protein
MSSSGIDDTVEVAETTVDRPAFSDRGDYGVVYPDPDHDDRPARQKNRDAASLVAALSDEELMADADVDPVFSTSEAAEFFDRSNQWLYWGLREGVFTRSDGTPIDPERIGDPDSGRRRFTIPIIREIAKSSYRRGNLNPDQLKTIMRRVRYAELGVEWREREGWRNVHLGRRRYRWVRPEEARYNNKLGEWEQKPEFRVKQTKNADTGGDQ